MDEYELIEAKYDPSKFASNVLDLDVQWFHKEWLELIQDNDRVVVTAPRGHGKTYMLGVVFPLWLATFKENKKIMIVGKTLEYHAKPILKEIKSLIYSYPFLKDLIPDKRNASWRTTEIDLSTGCTIFVRPNNDSIRGSHVDYAICDEVSEYDDQDVFFSCVPPAVENRKGKIACIGTPKTDVDLLAELNRNEAYASKEYQAIMGGNPLWPNRFTMERLMRIKLELGNLRFEREYMCKKIPLKTQLLPIETLEANFLPDTSFVESGEKKGIYYIGGDLAISQQKSADQTVFTIVEKKDGYAIIRDIKRMKGAHIKEQKFVLNRLYDRFHPRRILLDKATFGETLVQEMRQEGMPIYGYSFDSDSRMDLLNNMIALFDGMKLKIPRDKSDGKTIQHTDRLIEELTALGTAVTNSGQLTYKSFGRHPDYSMSLALACMSLKNLRSRVSSSDLMITRLDGNTSEDSLFMTGGNLKSYSGGLFQTP